MREFCDVMGWLCRAAALLVVIVATTVMLSGCASAPGSNGMQILPDIDCKGKISLSGQGSISAFAGATNSWSVMGDCGEGFTLKHGGAEPAPEGP